MQEEYFDRYSELILEFFMFNIHPIVFEPLPEKLDVKGSLRRYMYEYQQGTPDKIADITRRMQATLAMQSMISTYFLTRQLTCQPPLDQQEEAYSACTQKFVSVREMLKEFATQVDRLKR
jgi:hypothetical protein